MITLFRHISSLLTPKERTRLITLMLLDTAIQVADLAAMALLVFVTGLYTHAVPTAVSSFFPEIFTQPGSLMPVTLLLCIFLVKNLFAGWVYHRQYQFVYAVATRLSEQNLQHFFAGTYASYVNEDTAVATRRISQQPIEFAHYVLMGMQQALVQAVLVGVTVTGLLFFNARLCLLLLLLLVPVIAGVAFFIRRKTKRVRSSIQRSSEGTLQQLREALTGYVEAHVYDRQSFFTHRYTRQQQRLNHSLASLQGIQVLPQRLIEVFVVMGLFVVVASGQQHGGQGFLAIGAFVTAAYKVMPGVVKILNNATNIRVYAPTMQAMATNTSLPVSRSGRGIKTIENIRFADVGFSYEGKGGIRHFSALFSSGKLTIIHAPSGSGKTTVFNLLLGFLSPSSGMICINDQPADSDLLRELHVHISYIKQQPFLLHDTFLRNITLDENVPDETRLRQILLLTGLDKWLATLEDGLQTIISEQGKNISGGQMQRIGLARALYKDTPVLILDEPFSELDESSELELLNTLQRLKAVNKMIILVSHNPRCLAIGDEVVTLHEN